MNWKEISKVIDAALLKPGATVYDCEKLVNIAINDEYRAICVPPYLVSYAHELLKGSNVKLCSVVGFPFGYSTLADKLFEVRTLLEMGANEIDYVINIGAFLSYGQDVIAIEASKIVEEAKANGAENVKAIIEVGFFNEQQIAELSKVCILSGVDYIKTSSGYGPRATEVKDVKIIRKTIGNRGKIKASGGIKSLDELLNFLEAGADIIGTSHYYEIVSEAKKRFGF